MLEILNSIMKMSNDKHSTLMYFLDDNIQNKILDEKRCNLPVSIKNLR